MKKLLLVIIIFSSTGCWNYIELNRLAITTGIAVDIVDDEFEVTVLISNSQKEKSNSQISAAASVYSGKGKTIFEAIKDAARAISKQIYLSHIEVLVVSEDVAKNKMKDVTDFFFRYPQTRNEFLVVIAQDCSAKDTFLITTPLEIFPSQNISKNLEITSKLQGYIYTVKLNEFVKNIIEEGVNSVLPTISVIGNVEEGNSDDNIKKNLPSTYLKLGMLGIFNDYNLIAIANKNQSLGINIINNKIDTILIPFEYKDGYIVVEINELSTKITVDINDTPYFKISIKSNGSIEEASGDFDLNNTKEIEEIEKIANEEIKKLVNEAITLSQKTKTDIIGFGNIIYKSNPKYWFQIKEDWEVEMLENIKVDSIINLKLKTKGKTKSTIEVIR